MFEVDLISHGVCSKTLSYTDLFKKKFYLRKMCLLREYKIYSNVVNNVQFTEGKLKVCPLQITLLATARRTLLITLFIRTVHSSFRSIPIFN